MANRFYAPGEQRAAKVRELFNGIAHRYDLLNDLQSFGLHRCWKRNLVRLAKLKPGERALDVCCGTGDLAFTLAARGAEVTGLDFSPPMLRVGLERRSKARAPVRATQASPAARAGGLVSFVCGDALRLPLFDASFDLVTIGYGLRNLADLESSLQELLRVLKPSGRLCVLEFGKPDHPVWRRAYYAYLKVCVPLLGRLFCGSADAYAYILESLEHYPGQRGLAALMEKLGYKRVSTLNLLGGVMSINQAEKDAAQGL